jgi:cytochrome c biogenesis protein CcmG/thiol:disulfide interchange protein DsbE
MPSIVDRISVLVIVSLAACLLVILLAPLARASHPPNSLFPIDSVMSDSASLHNKVVYVDFWASWCGPCRQSFPFLNHLLRKYQDKGLAVLAVNLDRKKGDAEQFIEEMRSSLPVLFDSTGSLAKLYGLDAVPSSFIYGRDGRLRAQHEGFYPRDTLALDSLVTTLLTETKPK